MTKIGYQEGKSVENNVTCFLERNAELFPQREVLKWVPRDGLMGWNGDLNTPLEHDSITMAEFNRRIRHVAAGMKKLGLGHGDRAILFVPMSVQLYVAMSALQRIGAIPVFLDSWARRHQLGVSAEAVTPKALISFQQAFELCSQVPQLDSVSIKISVGPTASKYTAALEELVLTPEQAGIEPVEREETALITFTTGSSGTPKGANRTHRFLAAQHYALSRVIPYEDGDVDLPVFPIFSLNNIAGGISTVIPAIDVGVPSDKDPLILLAQLKSCGVTCTTLSPSLLNGLSGFCLKQGLKMPMLRRAVTGGAPISRDNLIDFTSAAKSAEVWVLYGSTEVEPMAHIEAKEMIGMKTRASEDPEWVDEGVNVGQMDGGLEYRFLKIIKTPVTISADSDWKEVEVPAGQVGELIVAGEHVCRDYYNNPEAFSRAKILDHTGKVWHRTGDLGRLDAEGNLWIVGRVHNAINRGGQYAFPVRAEIILKKLPFVRYGAYLGMPDAKLGESAVCVIVPDDPVGLGDPAAEAKWRSEIERIMNKNGVPVDRILFRERIPMDPRHHSKVEYDVLREELLQETVTA